MNPSFWQRKRVFITGHTGFKGSWLAFILGELGASVTGYSLAPATTPNLFSLLPIRNRINHIEADIRDFSRLKEALLSVSPDIVIHLAAQSLVRASFKDPRETYDVNLMGTVNVLEGCRSVASLRSLLVITTDKCYENTHPGTVFKETDRLGGADPYSSSKACAELAVESYRQSFFDTSKVGVATARAGNIIGGGDWSADRIIPDCVRAWSLGEPVTVRYPDAVRPWQHVFDPLAGYLCLCERLCNDPADYSQAWNFGPDSQKEVSVRHLVAGFSNAFRGGSWKEEPAAIKESHYLMLDSSKSKEKLDWKTMLSLDEMLLLTGEWYRSVVKNQDSAYEISKSQWEQFKGNI